MPSPIASPINGVHADDDDDANDFDGGGFGCGIPAPPAPARTHCKSSLSHAQSSSTGQPATRQGLKPESPAPFLLRGADMGEEPMERVGGLDLDGAGMTLDPAGVTRSHAMLQKHRAELTPPWRQPLPSLAQLHLSAPAHPSAHCFAAVPAAFR